MKMQQDAGKIFENQFPATVSDAMKFYRVSRDTIYRWIHSGTLEAKRAPGGKRGTFRVKLTLRDMPQTEVPEFD